MTVAASALHPNVARRIDMVKRKRAESGQNSGALDVFLLGPYIEVGMQEAACESSCSNTQLRHSLYWYLFNRCNVYIGEFPELTSSTEPYYGRENNPAVAEIHYARTVINAIVILPSSPGSFVEFGSFLVHKDICKKMLVILDKKYKKCKNYVNVGAVPMAENNGATILYLNYKDDVAKCKETVRNFIREKSTERFGKIIDRVKRGKRGKRS